MPNFWRVVKEVIRKSDMILLVLDARMVSQTRHPEIEQKVAESGKNLLYVLNKSDLVSKEILEAHKKALKNCVFMSAKKHEGTSLLRSAIMEIVRGEKVTVGVLGYPNVGKSSVINALCGGGSAPVAHRPGFTRGLQLLRVSEKLYVLDTPGVLPFQERSESKHLCIGSADPSRARDPESAALELLLSNKSRLLEWYPNAPISSDIDDDMMLEELARAWNFKGKSNTYDTRRAAIKVLMDWQRGRIV